MSSVSCRPSALRPRCPASGARRCRVWLGGITAFAAAAALLTGCSGSNQAEGPVTINSTPASTSGYDGDVLSQPLVLNRADLADSFRSTNGRTTTLATAGEGKLMLLYFGYTHCPDVCPTTMADLGIALQRLPAQDRFHTQVVFVTSDPARDTTAVMKTWLSHFDAGLPVPFLGMTSSISQIDHVAKSVGVPLSPPVKNADGSITVDHGAQTMAFQNGKATLLWLAGTTPSQYAHDITALFDRGSGS